MSKLPGVKHKVIGLVSGGKDSCFNLMHCIANGHEIVALATLTPEPGVGEFFPRNTEISCFHSKFNNVKP